MGLLDGILGNVISSLGQGSNNPLVHVATQMLTQQGQNGQSGLASIVSQFQQGGLGNLADSWVGTGQNLPVSGDQISQILGSGKLGEIASQLGISSGDAANGLSQILPELINQATPNGQMPQTADLISNALSAFLKR
jgi:uncharacterized protein YidB (DUF937 family)